MVQFRQLPVGQVGGSGEKVSWSVTQTSHGLAVGDVIYNNGTNYVKAQANATGTLGLFVVSAVADANTFTATFSGKITLSSLTIWRVLFCVKFNCRSICCNRTNKWI